MSQPVFSTARAFRPSHNVSIKAAVRQSNCRANIGPTIHSASHPFAFRNRQNTTTTRENFRAFHVNTRLSAAAKKPHQQPAHKTDKEELKLKMASAKSPQNDHYLTLSCPDKSGIVYAVTGLLAAQNLTILDLQQFSDVDSKTFFMRVHFGHSSDLTELKTGLKELAQKMDMDYDVRAVEHKPKVMIMVSKIGHCLNDLLYRVKSGQLKIEVPLIVSNHAEFASLAESYGIPFHHLPVTKDTKEHQEQQILDLIAQHNIDLIVLARYMQVLTPRLCSEMSGRIINIHHSFLPSFKGAKPYHQAYDRGVKIIGATAHFVTSDLDEGPIIEQRIARVDHAMRPGMLVEEGSNVESQVLAAAVKWWSERRVFLNGGRTVVFN
jgi:formyltetrahydrofolate deformylase